MSQRMKLLAPLAAALLAAGCSLAPKYERPELPVPSEFPYPSAREGAPVSELTWDRFFTDPQLRQLLARALQNNRDLRIAVANIAQARAQYGIRRADRFPTVGASFEAQRAPNLAGDQATTLQASLGVSSWEIDFFGRVANLSESALAQYLGTVEGRNAAQMALVANVAGTWLNLVADEELLVLTRQTLASREESLRLMRLRFDAGASSELDVRLAESLAETARVTLAQLQRQRANDLNALSLLVGEGLPTSLDVGNSTAAVSLPDVPAGLPSEVLVRRPDVRQAEQQLIAANADIGAARAAFFPRIALTAGVGSASSDLSGLFSSGAWGYTVIGSIAQTIFDAGRNRSGLEFAEAGREAAVAQYERAIQQAFRDVADALAGRETYADQVASQARVVEAETARYRLARLRFENGIASQLDLLDAQRSLFAAQQQLVQARLGRLQNQVQLYRSLGGGWE